MYRTPGAPIIHCPLCDVPHRLEAVRCDSCLQPLHEPVDYDALRSELLVRGRNAALGLVGVVGMLTLMMVMTRVVAGVIYVPAFVWTFRNAKRFLGLRRWLTKAKRERAAGLDRTEPRGNAPR
jgi:hypothetical protein